LLFGRIATGRVISIPTSSEERAGSRTASLPEQAAKFELVIDLKTAKALAAGRGGSRLFVDPRRLSLLPLLSGDLSICPPATG
jgi:hypothetical protein